MPAPIPHPLFGHDRIMVLSFQNVSLAVGKGAYRRRILSQASFSLERGEIIALIGPSGEGKTTVINMATGLIRPQEGSVITLGMNIGSATDYELSRLRAKRIGIVFQNFQLIPRLSALENILLPAHFGDAVVGSFHERARELLDRVGLSQWSGVDAVELSEGQRQRVAIARALLMRPGLILADEPTGNLDDAAALQVLKLIINEVRRENDTLFVATHDRRCLDLMDRVIVLNSGRISAAEAHLT